MVAICLEPNVELLCFAASPNLNAKESREFMQEGGQEVEATGSTRFHNALWNNIGSDRTSYFIKELIHLVSADTSNVSQRF